MRKRKRERKQNDTMSVRRFQFSCSDCRSAALTDLLEAGLSSCRVSGQFVECAGSDGPLAHARLRTLCSMKACYG